MTRIAQITWNALAASTGVVDDPLVGIVCPRAGEEGAGGEGAVASPANTA
jgi:hypothetical protein